jgi:hypothetical protein
MSMAMVSRSQNLTAAERRDVDRMKLVVSFFRFPIQSKTLLRYSVQVDDLDGAIDWAAHTPDPLLGGTEMILSTVPLYRGMPPVFRLYLTRYHDVLEPFFSPHVQTISPFDPQHRMTYLVLNALNKFPILNPSGMQASLGPRTSADYKVYLEQLVHTGMVTVWHPHLLEPTLAEPTMRRLKENVTYKGSRCFLTEHRDTLRPFLRREDPIKQSLQEFLETPLEIPLET